MHHEKNKKRLPVKSVCRNCGTPMISRYCHNCGQNLFAGTERSIRQIVGSLLDSAFAIDNKILRTLMYLLFFPGKLTNEYFAGRVVRYVNPSKLFWFISIVVFAVLSLHLNSFKEQLGTIKPEKENVIETTSGMTTTGFWITHKRDTTKTVSDTVKNKNNAQVSGKEDKEEDHDIRKHLPEIWPHIKDFISGYLPFIIFLLLPLFAALLYLFFRKHTHYYAKHIIFSLHLHSFIYTIIGMALILSYFKWGEAFPYMTIFFWIIMIYFIIALYRVYRPKIGEMIWKLPLFTILYALIATIFLIGIIGALILFLYNTGQLNFLNQTN